jgi:hypothetical protein
MTPAMHDLLDTNSVQSPAEDYRLSFCRFSVCATSHSWPSTIRPALTCAITILRSDIVHDLQILRSYQRDIILHAWLFLYSLHPAHRSLDEAMHGTPRTKLVACTTPPISHHLQSPLNHLAVTICILYQVPRHPTRKQGPPRFQYPQQSQSSTACASIKQCIVSCLRRSAHAPLSQTGTDCSSAHGHCIWLIQTATWSGCE